MIIVWNEERTRLLKRLHAAYTRTHVRGWRLTMSQLLGVRETQLIAKLGREYRAKRLQPIYTGHAWKPPKPKSPSKPKPPVVAPPTMAMVRTCQFPMWPNGTRPPVPPCYCGNKVEEGSSWCSQHRKQVYIPVKRSPRSQFVLFNHV